MKRVVVTGMGILSPLGNTRHENWAALCAGRSGIRSMASWKPLKGLRTHVAGEVRGVDPKEIPRKHRRTMGRVALLGAFAAREAVADAGLSQDALSSTRTGAVFGSTTGSGPVLEQFFSSFLEKGGFEELEGTLFMKVMGHTVASNIGALFGIRGRLAAPCSACASSTQAVGMAFDMIRKGEQEVMLCGGADDLHPSTAGVFDVVHAASKAFNDAPHRTPRPFDRDRDGLVVSEGASALVLEERDRALARGASLYGEILGFHTCCDGSHLTFPSEEGMVRSMEGALQDSKTRPQELSYVNAHATGTPLGDATEASAIRKLLGDGVPVSATKGYTGHTLAACGAMEAAYCLMMMREGRIIPSLNLENIDPECGGIHHVLHPVEMRPRRIMTSNFAFGGINATLVLGWGETE